MLTILALACASPPPLTAVAEPHADMASLLVVSWEQAEAASARVEFQRDGVWQSTPWTAANPGAAEITVPGLPFDTETIWRLVTEQDGVRRQSEDTPGRTGAAPTGLPEADVFVDLDGQDPNLEHLLLSISVDSLVGPLTFWTLVIDRQGRAVFALEAPAGRVVLQPRPSLDGRAFLVEENSYWGDFDGGAASVVHRLTLDGAVQETVAVPGLHHPYEELPDGSLAWGAAASGSETLEVRAPDGSQRTLWDCADFEGYFDPGEGCLSNTLRWHPDRGSFLFSFFTIETVIEIDGQTGEHLRWFGHAADAWAFADEDTAFWWQHGAHYTSDGTLLVSTHDEDGDETLVREYALDAETETLTEVWSFGAGEGLHGTEMGEAWVLENGNVLHNYGSAARLREVTRDGLVVWDLGFSGTGRQWLGRSSVLGELSAYLP